MREKERKKQRDRDTTEQKTDETRKALRERRPPPRSTVPPYIDSFP